MSPPRYHGLNESILDTENEQTGRCKPRKPSVLPGNSRKPGGTACGSDGGCDRTSPANACHFYLFSPLCMASSETFSQPKGPVITARTSGPLLTWESRKPKLQDEKLTSVVPSGPDLLRFQDPSTCSLLSWHFTRQELVTSRCK